MVDRVNVLGPLDMFDGGVRIRVDSPLEQAVLGYLAVHVNRPVDLARLIGRLLPTADPVSVRRRVQQAARRVATLVGDSAGPVTMEQRAGGSCYVLRAPSDGTDLSEARRRAGEARAAFARGASEVALPAFEAARGLWRGPLLDGVRTAEWPESAALHEELLLLTEDQLACRLAVDGAVPDAVVDELRMMAKCEPSRETLTGLLIDALQRQGRFGEAEHAYRTTASTLAERWGLDPSTELQDRLIRLRAVRAGEQVDPVEVTLLSVFRPIDDDAAATIRLCLRIRDANGIVVWRITRAVVAVFAGARQQEYAVDCAAKILRDRVADGRPETRVTVVSGQADGFRPENAATAGVTGPVVWGALLAHGMDTTLGARPGTITVDRATWRATRDHVTYRPVGGGKREMVLAELDSARAG